ncbi:putative damage-inducible protein DinB [Salinibacterium sp. CAN_S4]|uniref:DinB family protein n=1 Tax=Salinibacterium sp. CAN_S4 TaxID=2787727 RepID=UPI001A24DC0E
MMDDPKETLHRYLQQAREALLWKLDGASEYDIRRPLVPSGSNLLGIVKHVASVEAGYFGEIFGRPFPEPMPWFDDDAEPNADMWASADESREWVIHFYERVWAHSDATITALDLDAPGLVPWWSEERMNVTLHSMLVHMLAESHRHCGHADILRELIDGSVGHRANYSNMGEGDAAAYAAHVERLEAVARSFS